MRWEEPDVAMPVAAYTGQPMEEAPEGTRKRRRRPEDQQAEEAATAAETALNGGLVTGKTEGVRTDSSIRKSLRRSSRRHTAPVDYKDRALSPEREPEAPATDDSTTERAGKEAKKPRLRRTRRSKAANPYSTLRQDKSVPNGKEVTPETASPKPDEKSPKDKGDTTPKGSANGTATKSKASTKSKATNDEPNNDFCSACGGFGDFVCCEQCPKSFHLLCVDPPMSEDTLPDGAWYCNECTYKRSLMAKVVPSSAVKDEAAAGSKISEDSKENLVEEKLTIRIKTDQGREKERKEKKSRRKIKQEEPQPEQILKEVIKKKQNDPKQAQKWGLFGEMLEQLARRDPRVFSLPSSLQHRFDGVLVGEDGEFINEYELPPKKPRDREENMRLEDKDDKTVLCFRCSKSTLSGPIITCEKCKLPWHIDCLDPPQFNLPARWVCPNHVENAAKLPRRLRRQRVKDTVLRRGHRNNGLIEVYDEDDENKPTKYTPGLIGNVEDTETGLVAKMSKKQPVDEVYRVPSRSIQLDFIDFVHSQWRDPWRQTSNSNVLEILNELAEKPQPEREATRNLVCLKWQGPDVAAAVAKKNLDDLVAIALDDHDNQQALAIRELLQIKGRDRLLKFLNSD